MKEFVSALNAYHILNFLIPGVLFALFMDRYTDTELIQENTFVGIILYYFIGMILSRIGSLILEPLFKWIKILKQSKYKDYVKASAVDGLLATLLEMNNMYRGLLTMVLLLLLAFSLEPFGIFVFTGDSNILILLIVLVVIFVFAWRKQSNYIAKRVDVIRDNEFQLPKGQKEEDEQIL